MYYHDDPGPADPPITREERVYRRGCHQTAARLRDCAPGCRSLPQALDLLGRAEDVLAELRHEPAPVLDLLDEMETRLRVRAE
jgi:hypothetical protein